MTEPILIAKRDEAEFHLLMQMANRHGVITGATGTGKTVTLQKLAEGFSQRGVPVFASDIKGDLSGISQVGGTHPKIVERLQMLGMENTTFEGSPVTFWDVFGKEGHPLRATISEMGPLLLSRILQLNETQEGVLVVAFKEAQERKLPLVDLKDFQKLLQDMGENASALTLKYGNVTKATVGSILRGLLQLQQQKAENFFGEPSLDVTDFLRCEESTGRGIVNILAADDLIHNPKLYSTFLLWLLTKLYEILPEAGDLEKPKLVFIFDEAHLLFNEAPKALIEKIEQVVRLIRSKGVGVYFVTQSPADIPDKVLAQLGNRVQHALRAYTPKEQEAVKVAAKSFRENPDIDTVRAITELGVGEALISTLDSKGIPTIVERAFVVPPSSQIGPITSDQRQSLILNSPFQIKYGVTIDSESAYEILSRQSESASEEDTTPPLPTNKRSDGGKDSPAESNVLDSVKSAAWEGAKYAKTAHGTRTIKGIVIFLWELFTKSEKTNEKKKSK
jgi:DNA helicase HerA-like ATPase